MCLRRLIASFHTSKEVIPTLLGIDFVPLITCHSCFRKRPDKLILRAGEWDSKSEAELFPFQERKAQRIIVHKEYKSGPLYNDIALIILKDSFDFVENVDIVCLPNQNENVDYQKCVASGWGKDEFGKIFSMFTKNKTNQAYLVFTCNFNVTISYRFNAGEQGVYQNILKRVDLPIIPRDECLRRLRETRLTSKFILHASFVCAGGIEKQDTCKVNFFVAFCTYPSI